MLNSRFDALLFDAMICGDQCANFKPHPEPFQRACEALGVSPEASAAVGDSAGDILGAKAAGLHAIAAMWGVVGAANVIAAEPDSLATRPEDVLEIAGVEARP